MDEWSNSKPYEFNMDLDIDYLSVDPSLLQYNFLDDDQFSPFNFHDTPLPPPPPPSSGRRSSISSSASSSGASFSPIPESAPSPVDPAILLAEKVRQMAGVMLALPMTAQLQQQQQQQQDPPPPPPLPKLPIPRLPRPSTTSPTISAASTPPPTTPSDSSPPPPPRTKTSHTTIERRYRTNLNARIQSLRMAVPALRVVDNRENGKKRAPNKVLVSGDPLKSYTQGEDVVDERGFVDGVKVARKCSKANVLGKAVEYIRVLKKRENRLKAEQAGLKSLITGLVGGPALLREWEREWKALFGGEEKDEVDGDDADADDDDSDDDMDDDEDGSRKRKRGKTTPSSSDSLPAIKVEKKEKKIPSTVAAD
ncbi:hypothetical protein H0H93_014089, partial [Arthromyces matolae]